MKKKIKIALILSALLVGLTSCELTFGSNSTSNKGSTSVISTPKSDSTSISTSIQLVPTGVVISETNITIYINESYTLKATLLPSGVEGVINWSSSDENIVTVDNGVVKGKNIGNATIFATYDTFVAKTMVTVTEKSVSSVSEVHLYAMNDFHGAVNAQSNELGLLKNGTFFKEKGKEDNTLILNSGDMWQGSLESNINYGEFLTKAMNSIEFDCFTLGNHEFDWGGNYIASNKTLYDSTTNYQTPFLAANIYNYDINNHQVLSHADELGQEYVVRTLENGLRVGIIGVIGEDQITSISSQFADSYTFLNPTEIIKNLSDELRSEKNCDVIVVDAHASYDQVDKSITDVSSKTNKKYADAVFCAHSHQYENYVNNDVPFVQASCNGKAYSEIHLKVTNGNVSLVSSDNSGTASNITKYDESLTSLYNEYKTIADKIGNEKLAYLDEAMSSSCNYEGSLPKLITKAMAIEASTQGFNVDFAICNQARAWLQKGNITYTALAKSMPFNNEMYVMKVKGSTLKRQLTYNSFYRVIEESISTSKTYTIVVIDYLALHRNSNREYDYFSGFEMVGKLTKNGYAFYTYRDMVAEYLRINKSITASDYSSYNDSHFALK